MTNKKQACLYRMYLCIQKKANFKQPFQSETNTLQAHLHAKRAKQNGTAIHQRLRKSRP